MAWHQGCKSLNTSRTRHQSRSHKDLIVPHLYTTLNQHSRKSIACQSSTVTETSPSISTVSFPFSSVMPDIDQQAEQHPIICTAGTEDSVDSIPEHLKQEWDRITTELEGVLQARHMAHRKKKISALRKSMQDITDQLPVHIGQQLEEQLVKNRSEASKQRKERLEAAYSSGPQLVVDCGFASEHCRPGAETRSLAKQVEWAMAVNRGSDAPLGLHAVSWSGEVKQQGELLGCNGWAVRLHVEPLSNVFTENKLVVLSPDASQPLMTLDDSTVYVVGGIVDRTVKKGVTATFAAEHRLPCVRLPITEYSEELGIDTSQGMCKRPVLNVSDVLVALIEYHRTKDWVYALDKAIPDRKRRAVVPRLKRVCGQDFPDGRLQEAATVTRT